MTNENRKILSKLPDWLTARWNQKIIEVEDVSNQFPSFSQFVKFLTKEAKIAYNPVTSLQSLKQGETENPSTNVENVRTCIFCKKTRHTLLKCRKFMEQAVSDRIKFVQAEKLCVDCLKSS